MGSCAACGKTILFGGVEVQGRKTCNQNCAAAFGLMIAAQQIPEGDAQARAQEIRSGTCPKCRGNGQPVEVQRAHRCLSFLIMTRRSSSVLIACHACGNKLRLQESLISFFFGWWGFPWGLVFTPMQIGKNISMMMAAPSVGPSPELVALARNTLVRERGTSGQLTA